MRTDVPRQHRIGAHQIERARGTICGDRLAQRTDRRALGHRINRYLQPERGLHVCCELDAPERIEPEPRK